MFRVLLSLIALVAVSAQNSKWYKPCQVDEGCACLSRPRIIKCCCVGPSVTQIPANITAKVKILVLHRVGIEKISEDAFERLPQLEEVIIQESPSLTTVDAAAFRKLDKLSKLEISGCKNFAHVDGPLLQNNKYMISLAMNHNALTEVPLLRMSGRHQPIEEIDFSNNKIEKLKRNRFISVDAVLVVLSHNKIKDVEDQTFANCKFLTLDLSNNIELEHLSPNAFANISVIQRLNLSFTRITSLPTNGLKELETLSLEGTKELKKLPPILAFTTLRQVQFTYAHHCCLFKHASNEIVSSGRDYEENMEDIISRVCRRPEDYYATKRKRSVDADDTGKGWDEVVNEWIGFGKDDDTVLEVSDDEMPLLPVFESTRIGSLRYLNCTKNAIQAFYSSIVCSPLPNALNPCENVVGYQPLRYAIWFIWISAIVGNIGVWIVLITLKQKRMRVHYFFMANLSTADLLTGVYLGMLAIEDVRTSDEYYNYAVEWQTGFGCQIAGFISVFASELSILSMFLIAFEMWYNVRYAFYGRRFKERAAYISIICVHIFAFTMAMLPILGVSSYKGTSVCLPLTIDDIYDKSFLMFGLCFNLIAFLGMAFCYACIVKMLRNPEQPSRPEDTAVIAKMAILIGTDMLCWFPTLFFGLTASLNIPLISISVAKIFLVFFYPINAFANPFLYVFFTKVVKNSLKPCVQTCLKKLSQPAAFRSERTYSTLLNFYHVHPPNGNFKLDELQKLMQMTPGSHMDYCTPRGSSASTSQKTVTSIISGLLPRGSIIPRLSVQDDLLKSDVSTHIISKHGKTFIVSNPRISTAPEMSDISENSMSDDHTLTKSNPNVHKTVVPEIRIDDSPLNSAIADNSRDREESSASDVFLVRTPLLSE